MRKIIALILGLVLPVIALSAQGRITVKGQVTDENGEALPGTAVIEKGTSNGVLTDRNGNYAITVSAGAVLMFSSMGYKEISETVGKRSAISVSLSSDTTFLDEAVVVGYGTMKRSDLTGSVSSVSAKTLENFRSGDIMTALGGQLAGVNVTSSDGTPGGGYSILIRGVGTVNGDASPLYIVDG
ncbi:MAG: carboxypeptidase-like regulatory domain-containing protein, partial [Bacteroidales bacterium]|nr:carboxypeptidase-like regulatory domain-containing protein [Bacteroidales bacterium]